MKAIKVKERPEEAGTRVWREKGEPAASGSAINTVSVELEKKV